ncbi:hypothetical protein GUJ93_ZPchr0013g37563 [Zizania palustris]|uniref:Uncharacterized protein n=1 Tax=Zizania palustris TaxID=103762 RepID=A0A8J5WZ98_ZIZPA|nr:hypothetical protein GUJ93_ZPchr0013g37563 [Zizania palustris]
MVVEISCSKRDVARGAEVEDEDDGEYERVFYEDIEAPKFVDLTAPDAARPADDTSWFCLRIGCDQNHEQVDPEALHRSFFMRVMAARSPNVRLQKAISRRNQSSMLKYPHSAPPKPPRARIARLSTATEAAEKAAKPKLKTHRICTLRASPTLTKEAAKPSAKKKALTTPRSKAIRTRQDPFLSTKHQKEPVAAAKKGTVVKALFMSTPKKDAGQTPTKSQAPPLSEVCSKMRKLNLACREVPSRYLCPPSNRKTPKKCDQTATKSAKTGQESRPDAKKRIFGRSVKHANADEAGKENRVDRENPAADDNACTENATSNEERSEVIQEPRNEVEIVRAENYDDNKENMPCVDQVTEPTAMSSLSEGENLQLLASNENVPHKVAKVQSKSNAEQGGKLKKTTNPKPFRLRTGERGVLKEANPERNHTLTENNYLAALKDRNKVVVQTGRCHDGKGRDNPTRGEKQKKQIRKVATGQLAEAKTILNSMRPRMTNGNTVGKSERACRLASSTRSAKTTRFAPKKIILG